MVRYGRRQIGSTFKPFVYATAIEQLGMSPCDSIIDSPFTIPVGRHHVTEDWTPKNSDNKYRGMVTLKKALVIIEVQKNKGRIRIDPDHLMDWQ